MSILKHTALGRRSVNTKHENKSAKHTFKLFEMYSCYCFNNKLCKNLITVNNLNLAPGKFFVFN